MPSLTDFKALSFDCYGTLVDWERGIAEGLLPIASRAPADSLIAKDSAALVRRFNLEADTLQAAAPETPYKDVLKAAFQNVAEALEIPSSPEAAADFSAAIGSWPVFPDTLDALQRLKKHYKLVILSNIDGDSMRQTQAGPLSGIAFDAVYIAQDIGSYKPDARNFEHLARRSAEDLEVPRDKLLHTAYALHHDLKPAHELGLHTCYIERSPNVLGGRLDEAPGVVTPGFVFPTLRELADAADAAFAANMADESGDRADAQGDEPAGDNKPLETANRSAEATDAPAEGDVATSEPDKTAGEANAAGKENQDDVTKPVEGSEPVEAEAVAAKSVPDAVGAEIPNGEQAVPEAVPVDASTDPAPVEAAEPSQPAKSAAEPAAGDSEPAEPAAEEKILAVEPEAAPKENGSAAAQTGEGEAAEPTQIVAEPEAVTDKAKDEAPTSDALAATPAPEAEEAEDKTPAADKPDTTAAKQATAGDEPATTA